MKRKKKNVIQLILEDQHDRITSGHITNALFSMVLTLVFTLSIVALMGGI